MGCLTRRRREYTFCSISQKLMLPICVSNSLVLMPEELYALAIEDPVTVDEVRHSIANNTAAPFQELDKVILQLAREGEFDILDSRGKLRSRKLTRLDRTDRIAIPAQRLFPGLSRR